MRASNSSQSCLHLTKIERLGNTERNPVFTSYPGRLVFREKSGRFLLIRDLNYVAPNAIKIHQSTDICKQALYYHSSHS